MENFNSVNDIVKKRTEVQNKFDMEMRILSELEIIREGFDDYRFFLDLNVDYLKPGDKSSDEKFTILSESEEIKPGIYRYEVIYRYKVGGEIDQNDYLYDWF